ncbi:hypothetical protein BDW66DRAFT_103089 [Aspergillus desertorum]
MRLCPLRGLWRDWVPLARRLNAAPFCRESPWNLPSGLRLLLLQSTECRIPTTNAHPPHRPVNTAACLSYSFPRSATFSNSRLCLPVRCQQLVPKAAMRPLTATGTGEPTASLVAEEGKEKKPREERKKTGQGKSGKPAVAAAGTPDTAAPGTTWHGLTARLHSASRNSRLLLHLLPAATEHLACKCFLCSGPSKTPIGKLFNQRGPNLNFPQSQESVSRMAASSGTRWLDRTSHSAE